MTGKVIHHRDFGRPQTQEKIHSFLFLFHLFVFLLCSSLYSFSSWNINYPIGLSTNPFPSPDVLSICCDMAFFLLVFSVEIMNWDKSKPCDWPKKNLFPGHQQKNWTNSTNRTNVPRNTWKSKNMLMHCETKQLSHKTSILNKANRLSRTFCIRWKCQVNYNNRIELVSP